MHIGLIRSFLMLRSEFTSQAHLWNLILSAAVLGDGTLPLGGDWVSWMTNRLSSKKRLCYKSICDELALSFHQGPLTCCHAGKVFSWDMSRHRCHAIGLSCLNFSLSGQADFKLLNNPDCFHSGCPHASAAVALRKTSTAPRKEPFLFINYPVCGIQWEQ